MNEEILGTKNQNPPSKNFDGFFCPKCNEVPIEIENTSSGKIISCGKYNWHCGFTSNNTLDVKKALDYPNREEENHKWYINYYTHNSNSDLLRFRIGKLFVYYKRKLFKGGLDENEKLRVQDEMDSYAEQIFDGVTCPNCGKEIITDTGIIACSNQKWCRWKSKSKKMMKIAKKAAVDYYHDFNENISGEDFDNDDIYGCNEVTNGDTKYPDISDEEMRFARENGYFRDGSRYRPDE